MLCHMLKENTIERKNKDPITCKEVIETKNIFRKISKKFCVPNLGTQNKKFSMKIKKR